jgi:hypothetical protein
VAKGSGAHVLWQLRVLREGELDAQQSTPRVCCPHAVCSAPAVSVGTTSKLVKLQALKGQEDMTDVLLRNVYGDDTSRRHNAAALAQYVRRCAEKTEVSMLQSAMLQ